MYELANSTLKESLTTSDPSVRPAGWDANKHEITCRIVDASVPRRSAAGFINWYAESRRRLGWKTVSAK